jgi:hypothetical protein
MCQSVLFIKMMMIHFEFEMCDRFFSVEDGAVVLNLKIAREHVVRGDRFGC